MSKVKDKNTKENQKEGEKVTKNKEQKEDIKSEVITKDGKETEKVTTTTKKEDLKVKLVQRDHNKKNFELISQHGQTDKEERVAESTGQKEDGVPKQKSTTGTSTVGGSKSSSGEEKDRGGDTENSKPDSVIKVKDPLINVQILKDLTTQVLATSSLSTPDKAIIVEAGNEGLEINLKGDYKSQFKLLRTDKTFKIPTLVDFIKRESMTQSKSQYRDARLGLVSEPLFQNAYDLFSDSILTIRAGQKTKLFNIELPDMNNMISAVDVIKMPVVKGAEGELQWKRIDAITSKLFNLISAYVGLDKMIMTSPAKVVLSGDGVSQAFRFVTEFKPASSDNPHPLFAGVIHNLDYIQREILNINRDAPAQFGELRAITDRFAIKVAATWACVTDQFTAFILNTNFRELREKRARAAEWLLVVRACAMLSLTNVELRDARDAYYPLIIRPSRESQNMFFLYMLMSKTAKITNFKLLSQILNASNRITMHDVNEILNMPDHPNQDYVNFFTNLRQQLSLGMGMDPANFAVLETFCHNFRINVTTPEISDALSNVSTIAALISWFLVCPRLAQTVRCELGYWIMVALKNLVGETAFGDAINQYGWYLQRVDNRWVPFPGGYNRVLYTSEVDDTIRPLIFTDFEVPANVRQRRILGIMGRIRDLCQTRLYPEELIHKRQAGLIFGHADYRGMLSWQRLDLQNVEPGRDSDLVQNIRRLIGIIQDLDQYHTQQQGRVYRTTGTRDWMVQFIGILSGAADNAAALFNYTMADVQYWLMNQPTYVMEFAKNEPFSYPNEIGVGCERFEVVENVPAPPIPILKQEVSINVMFPLTFLLAGQGDFKRDVTYRQIARFDKRKVELSDEIKPIDFEKVLELYYRLQDQADKFALPLSLLYNLTHPNAPNNPIYEPALEISRFIVTNQWNSIAAMICKAAQTPDINELLQVMTMRGIIEPRYLQPRIVKVSKSPGGIEIPTNDPLSLIGQRLEITDNFTNVRLRTLAQLFISDESPFSNLASGLRIGRFFVDDRVPTIPDQLIAQQFPRLVDIQDVTFEYQNRPNIGNIKIVTFGDLDPVDSPYSDVLQGIRLQVDNLSQIDKANVEWILQAVYFGRICLEIRDKQVRYKIVDESSKTVSLNESISVDDLLKIFNQQDAEEFEHEFLTTQFALNLNGQELGVHGYIQWFSLIRDPRNDLVIASVYPGMIRLPDNHVPLDADMWGFGFYADDEDMEGVMPVSRVRKLAANKLNMNNKLYTVLDGYLDPAPKLLVSTKNIQVSNVQ